MKRIVRLLVTAFMTVTLTMGGAPVAFAQSTPGPIFIQPVHPEKAPAPQAVQAPQGNQNAPAPAFDGKALYKAAFEAIRDSHILLADPKFREAWIKEWESKFSDKELATEKDTDAALLRLTQSLKQRYDYFFDKDDTAAEKAEVSATSVGIGVTLRLSKIEEIVKGFPKDIKPEDAEKALLISKENALVVEEPIPGGPADKAGLKPGDVIRKVDGQEISGKSMKSVINDMIKGKEKTDVEITVERTDDKGAISEVTVKITRAVFTVPVVTVKDLGDGVTYVKLRNFMSKNAMTEMRDALRQAAKGKALVLDLRGNPGGSLTAVLTMTGMLLQDGPVLITKSRNGDSVVEAEITMHKDFVLRIDPDDTDPKNRNISIGDRPRLIIPTDMPIVVLVDEGSASASEILSGVLQHNKRAIIVGKPTVGKGVGQSVIDLPFGRRLHVTTFEFIPGRTPNDWIGVIPDHDVERGADPKVDGQLDKAEELLKKAVEEVEAMRAKRAEQEKKHREEFERQLQKR